MAHVGHDQPITMRQAERQLAAICAQLERLDNNTNERMGQFEGELHMAAVSAKQARLRLSDRIFAQLRTDQDKELNKC